MSEFPDPANNFLESDILFRPTTPTHDVKGSSSPNFATTQLIRNSDEESVLFG
jgi:hypothetical protein